MITLWARRRGVGVVALFLCQGACEDGSSPASARGAQAVQVKTVAPLRRDVVRKLDIAASLDPWQQVTLFAKASGFVRQIRVDRGDRVKKGDLIAVLDVPEAYTAIARARAELEQASITAKRLSAIRAQEPGAVSLQEVDSAKNRMSALEAAAQGELTLASYTRIEAPFDGIVTDRYVDVGALVAAGTSGKATPIVKVVDASRLRVVVDVPEVDVPSVKVGNAAELKVDALPGQTFTGTVSRRAEALDSATRTMRVEVMVDNADGSLSAGMFGRVRLDLETRQGVLAVEPLWMKQQKDQFYVFVATANGSEHLAKRVNIRCGADDGKFVEVIDGLSESDAVIAAAAAPLKDGTSIVPSQLAETSSR